MLGEGRRAKPFASLGRFRAEDVPRTSSSLRNLVGETGDGGKGSLSRRTPPKRCICVGCALQTCPTDLPHGGFRGHHGGTETAA